MTVANQLCQDHLMATKYLKNKLPLMAVLMAASIGLLFLATDTVIAAERENVEEDCVNKSLDVVNPNFRTKIPTDNSLPEGYHLEEVSSSRTTTELLYWNQSLCNPEEPSKKPIDNGAITVITWKASDGTDENEFVQKYMEKYSDDVPTLKIVDVNGKAGIGREPFEGKSVIIRAGEIIEDKPLMFPAKVMFYDQEDDTMYSLRSFESLDTLLKIAQSLQ